MKILVEFDLRIYGKYPQRKVRKNFLKWFELLKWKISPDEDDDDYQVWIERIVVKGGSNAIR
mgnify:CR=1 FL=1